MKILKVYVLFHLVIFSDTVISDSAEDDGMRAGTPKMERQCGAVDMV